ncbi:LytR/AlgR family response regulator transcription factor [Dinghuibacter silviterrae]|uniref:LytTR family two component transcriptional regulator n=1 Tax=Dinghuibacter silviterrae TaxID=1539049 RepID=A0A4R8DEW0_9BACT|nr:LytTR family DNA-binding domain-containing protein [Dinghuibacter silviterrae]TDW95985.1 LytTR family two component transcriptional regulator [Dinghuibacter silviterrae]
MLRCIAVDDEQLALDLLEDNIRQVPFLELVKTCRNTVEATRALEEGNIDLVFMDIQMPGMTGLQWINAQVRKPMVILITAYEKYALQGFDLEVVDYLLKPVSLERFIKACNRARELRPSTDEGFFFVHVDYSLVKIVFKDIAWIEGLKDYIKIYLKGVSKPVITRMGMKTIEDMLPTGRFIRVHKSYIVSVESIHSIRKNSIFLGETEIPVSDHYRAALQALTRRPG